MLNFSEGGLFFSDKCSVIRKEKRLLSLVKEGGHLEGFPNTMQNVIPHMKKVHSNDKGLGQLIFFGFGPKSAMCTVE